MSQAPSNSQKTMLVASLFTGIATLAITVVLSVLLLLKTQSDPVGGQDGVNPQLDALEQAIEMLATLDPGI